MLDLTEKFRQDPEAGRMRRRLMLFNVRPALFSASSIEDYMQNKKDLYPSEKVIKFLPQNGPFDGRAMVFVPDVKYLRDKDGFYTVGDLTGELTMPEYDSIFGTPLDREKFIMFERVHAIALYDRENDFECFFGLRKENQPTGGKNAFKGII